MIHMMIWVLFQGFNPRTSIHPVDSLSAVVRIWACSNRSHSRSSKARAPCRIECSAGGCGPVDGSWLRVDDTVARGAVRSAHDWRRWEDWCRGSHYLHRTCAICPHSLLTLTLAADVPEGSHTHEKFEESKSGDHDWNYGLDQIVSLQRILVGPIVDACSLVDFKSAENNHGRGEDKSTEKRKCFEPAILSHWIAASANS